MYWIPNYDISIGKISHSMAKPYELTFENIHIQDKTQSKNNLTANKLIVGLKSNHLLQYQSFSYVYVMVRSMLLLIHKVFLPIFYSLTTYPLIMKIHL